MQISSERSRITATIILIKEGLRDNSSLYKWKNSALAVSCLDFQPASVERVDQYVSAVFQLLVLDKNRDFHLSQVLFQSFSFEIWLFIL